MIHLQNVGIDAITLSNNNFKQIDMEQTKPFRSNIKLKEANSDSNVYTRLTDINTGEVLDITSMLLMFHGGIGGYKGLNNIQFRPSPLNPTYNCVHATLPTVIDGNNLCNINNIDDLKETIDIISGYYKQLGFSDANIYKSNIKEVELNININLNYDFSKYKRTFEFISNNMNQNESIAIYDKGFKFSNSSIDIKVYDKKHQLLNCKECIDTHVIDSNSILRLEVTFKEFRNRKSLQPIKTVHDLIFNGGLDILKEEFAKVITKYIYNDTINAIIKQKSNAIKWIQKGKKSSFTTSLDLPLQKGNALFDIQILLEALRETESTSNFASQCKKCINKALLSDDHGVLFSNLTKINEIYHKIGFKPYEPNLTHHIKEYIQEVERNDIDNQVFHSGKIIRLNKTPSNVDTLNSSNDYSNVS